MKRIVLIMLMSVGIASGQMRVSMRPLPYVPPLTPLEQTKAYTERERTFFKPAYPWREVGLSTVYAKGDGWFQFVGCVLEVHKGGIRVRGWCGAPMTWPSDEGTVLEIKNSDPQRPLTHIPGDQEFFVENFPFKVAEGDYITWEQKLVAQEDGTYSYNTISGGSRTLHQLNFGMIASPPPPAPLTEAQKQAALKAKSESAVKTLEFQKQLAEKGDAYGLFRMGQRYLTGDGVEKDEVKGVALLRRASDAGNAEAEAALQKFYTASKSVAESH